ncbi:phosphatase PAP2 family protein [Aquitalea aquatica]|uniref:Phosphatase PAP2 family protein n=1 Tax=Aquitalea aquatica TaxID=3044273 RepID=A0A838Y4L4_9NEIS|nr:phosphatase PAP2 family protein [Aquitalea magnusonii]MBA4710323.1 phosphatase PAP2 family protein [Aquitalea magnusonii]
MNRLLSQLPPRLRHLLLGWGSVGCAYTLGSLRSGPAWVLPELASDRLLAFDPSAIWLYLSFFLLVPAAFWLTPPQRLRWLQHAMQLSALLAGLVFLLWPTTLVYPPALSAPSHGVLQLLLQFDTPGNCLPSLHGALTWLALSALWDGRRPWRNTLLLLWALAIMLAVVQLRRHLTLDLGAGLLLGLFSGWLAARPVLHSFFRYRCA